VIGGLEYADTESDHSVASQVLSRLLCVASGLSEAAGCLGGRCKENEAVRDGCPILIRPTAST
jgi:hypothetical protein